MTKSKLLYPSIAFRGNLSTIIIQANDEMTLITDTPIVKIDFRENHLIKC